MSTTYNIPRDSTLQELVALQKAALIGGGDPGAIDSYYCTLVNKCTNVDQVNALFKEWWNSQYVDGSTSRVDLLERWFGNVLDDDRVHGVKLPLFSTSTTAIGEKTDDSAGLTCVPSTETTEGKDEFAHLPQFWCVEASAEKNADGTITVYAVEGIDDIDDVRSGEHLCWVFQKNTYCREWNEDGYRLFKTRCHAASGYKQWKDGKTKDGVMHSFMAHPKYVHAGLDANGKITCGTGLDPVLWTSHNGGVALWRARGSMYSGGSMNVAKFLLRMMWLKYARKGNSGTIEGCSAYNYQYRAAVSESGVNRIIITTAQAANLYVGSNVELGDNASGTDRNTAASYSIARLARITAIDEISIAGTTYAAVYVDTDNVFDTTAGTTLISTMPYPSGWNDSVQGFDGSRYNYTNGKEPGLLQKIEFQNGAYVIFSDELWQWSQDSDGNYLFDCYTIDDQSKVTTNGTISSNYEKQEALTLTWPARQSSGWQYIEDTAINEDTLWPENVSTAAGSGTGVKAGFGVYPAASGVRAAWCFANLNNGGNCGLAARNSNNSATNTNWNGSLGAQLVMLIGKRFSVSHRIFLAYARKLLETSTV